MQVTEIEFISKFMVFLVIAAQNFCSERVAPIFRVSSVTGEGLDNLKTFFNLLQPRIPTGKINDRAEFTVDDVFSVPGVGTVVSGTLVSGKVKAGDTMLMGPDSMGKFEQVHIKSIHRKRLPVQEVVAGQAAAFALKKIKKNQVRNSNEIFERIFLSLFEGTKRNGVYWSGRRSAESCLGI